MTILSCLQNKPVSWLEPQCLLVWLHDFESLVSQTEVFHFLNWEKKKKNNMALIEEFKSKTETFHFMCVYECMYMPMQQCKESTESVGLIVLSLISVPLQASHLWQGL